MCRIGHLNNYNLAFRVYIHVHYNNRVIEFCLNFPGLKNALNPNILSNSCSITYSDIFEQILSTKKKILGHKYTTQLDIIVRPLALKPLPLIQGLEVHNLKKHSSS